MRIVEKIKEREMLTPAESQIAEYLRKHPDEVVNMPLDELAEKIYVSKSTIIRFCKKLGFLGHKELCLELAKELNSYDSDTHIDLSIPFSPVDSAQDAAVKMMLLNRRAVEDAFHDADISKLKYLAAQILAGRNIIVLSSEIQRFIAMDFASRMQMLGYPVQMNMFGSVASVIHSAHPENTMVLMISYSGREKALIQYAHILDEKKVPLFVFAGAFASPLKKYADHMIEIGYYKPQPVMAAGVSRTGLQLLFDIVYAIVFHADYERHMEIINAEGESVVPTGESVETV